VSWDGRDAAGSQAASGVYYAELRTDGAAMRKRLVLVR
jgi:hypothetical protein